MELRALLVEDSVVHQQLLERAFGEAGRTVRLEVHGDGDQAWAAVDRLRFKPLSEWPDFAIVDLGLPGMSGIDLVDRIRKLRHLDDWPVIVLTASRDPEDRAESMLAKATGYFVKPATAAGYVRLAGDILHFLGYGPDPTREKPKAAPRQKAGQQEH